MQTRGIHLLWKKNSTYEFVAYTYYKLENSQILLQNPVFKASTYDKEKRNLFWYVSRVN